nr:ORF2 [Epsilontorquevirus sp.]
MLGERKERVWFDTCRRTHSLFCTCGDWINHALRIHSDASREWDEWLTGGDDGGAADRGAAAGGEPGGAGGGDVHGTAAGGDGAEDAAMAAAAAAIEDADRSDTEDSSEGRGGGW